MAKKDKKIISHKKLLIRDGVLLGANVVGGITGLSLASNVLLTGLAGVTLALSGVWIALGIKAIKDIKNKKANLEIDNDKWLTHNKKYKLANAERKKEIKQEKSDFKVAKKEILNKKDTSKKEKTELIKEKKIEEKAHLKQIPKKSRYRHAKRLAILAAGLSGVLTLGCGIFFAKEFETASAYANEANQKQEQYLNTETVKNLGVGVALASIQVANTVVATLSARNIARKREDEIIEYEEVE